MLENAGFFAIDPIVLQKVDFSQHFDTLFATVLQKKSYKTRANK